MVGIALGQMGMSLSDFDALSPTQFALAFKYYLKTDETAFKRSWEQTRFMVAALLSPHSKKALKPSDICRFDWDEVETKKEVSSDDIARAKERFKELEKRWG